MCGKGPPPLWLFGPNKCFLRGVRRACNTALFSVAAFQSQGSAATREHRLTPCWLGVPKALWANGRHADAALVH